MDKESIVQCCVITATSPTCVTKTFNLVDGKLEKATSANVYSGSMQIRSFRNAKEFATFLQQLTSAQCLTYGIPPCDAGLVTQEVWEKLGRPVDPLPRSNTVFSWPEGAGILMLDYDAPKDGTTPMGRKAIVKALLVVCPDLNHANLIWWPSTSSYIHAGDEELTGLKGQRLYLFVKDASDIERAGKTLNERLWAIGHGRYEVSKSGGLLKRCMFDGSVWQTNRVDFAAGAMCGPGLEQRRGEPFVLGGDTFALLDTRAAIPPLSEAESQRCRENQEKFKLQLSAKAEEVQAQWIANRVDQVRKVNPSLAIDQAKNLVVRALETGDLSSDWLIIIKTFDGSETQITVGEVLAQPLMYDGALTLDPIEPDYDGRRWVGKLFINSDRARLHSFAHGAKTYRLHQQRIQIELVAGKLTESTNKVLEVLRRTPDIFDFGAELVRVAGGQTHGLDEKSLPYVLGIYIQFFKRGVKKNLPVEVLCDPPTNLCASITALRIQRDLRKLTAVITVPTLRPDGSVLDTAGYDIQTGLLYDPMGREIKVPHSPTLEQAVVALNELWFPFQDFPFCGPLDRAVHLAALLTSTVRSSLPAAPGFAYDAPVQGSGKTLLARCVGALVQGYDPGVWPHTTGGNDEEIRKRIFTVLRSGARVLIWDNLVGSFDSAALASSMTSPNFSDRILGQSTSTTVPNRMLLLLTGNNLQFQGELPRRVLISRIDPRSEKPFSRSFKIEPFSYCIANRQSMIVAALTLLRAYLTIGCVTPVQGKLASFEEWDLWVRRTVVFADELIPGMFGDVMDVVKGNQGVDPELEALGILLAAWDDCFPGEAVSVFDIVKSLTVGQLNLKQKNLRDSIEGLPIDNRHQFNNKAIGKYIGFRKGRIVDGRCFEPGPKINDRQTWCVKRV